jgi:predicted ATPase
MLVGAYCDNEVNPAHPLILKLEAMRRAGATGNPFFAIQFISALAEEGLLTVDHGDGRWSQLGVPLLSLAALRAYRT